MSDPFAAYQDALRNGHQRAAEGRFKEALEQYQAAAALAGERARPHVFVGGMLLRLGNAQDALAAYERALALEADDPDALSGRVAALLAAGRRGEAAEAQRRIEAAREEQRAEPALPPGIRTALSSSESLALAGEEARDAGRREAAIDAWLAETREHLAARKFDAALDAGLRALSVDPRAARVHLELSRVYLARNWKSQADERLAALGRLLELAPDPMLSEALAALRSAQA